MNRSFFILAAMGLGVVGCAKLSDSASPPLQEAATASETYEVEVDEKASGEGAKRAAAKAAASPAPDEPPPPLGAQVPEAKPLPPPKNQLKPKIKANMFKDIADLRLDGDEDKSRGGRRLKKRARDSLASKGEAEGAAEGEALDLPAKDDAAAPAFLPRAGYFANTYIGGNAGYRQRMRRLDQAFAGQERVWRGAALELAELDAPPTAGLAVHAALSHRSLTKPGRVFLQVALRGSDRAGWSRPPLDVAVVIDPSALAAGRERAIAAVQALLGRLSGRDRVAVVLAGADRPQRLHEPGPVPDVRAELGTALLALRSDSRGGSTGAALALAGAALQSLAGEEHRIPGTRLAIVLCGAAVTDAPALQQAAHALTTQGTVTSVFVSGAAPTTSALWAIANAGHGNLHELPSDDAVDRAVDEELASIARVVARLVRVNVRLGRDSNAVRIIGSHLLGQRERRLVKAREEAMDRNLSKALGVGADRGADDDGLQTVIPYFYGGDRHAILIELQVDKPGHVADVEVRYKDLVNLDNATARASVALRSLPTPQSPEQAIVLAAAQSAAVSDVLDQARAHVKHGRYEQATATLQRSARDGKQGAKTRRWLRDVGRFIDNNRAAGGERQQALETMLDVARQRQVGAAR